MENRPKQLILYLISLEVKRRQTYWKVMKELPRGFSKSAITQMRKIIEMKDLTPTEKSELLTEVKTFELTTR